jgi:hypothetical protein
VLDVWGAAAAAAAAAAVPMLSDGGQHDGLLAHREKYSCFWIWMHRKALGDQIPVSETVSRWAQAKLVRLLKTAP